MAYQVSDKTACNTCTDKQIISKYAHVRWLDFLFTLQQIRTSMTDTYTFLFDETSSSGLKQQNELLLLNSMKKWQK